MPLRLCANMLTDWTTESKQYVPYSINKQWRSIVSWCSCLPYAANRSTSLEVSFSSERLVGDVLIASRGKQTRRRVWNSFGWRELIYRTRFSVVKRRIFWKDHRVSFCIDASAGLLWTKYEITTNRKHLGKNQLLCRGHVIENCCM